MRRALLAIAIVLGGCGDNAECSLAPFNDGDPNGHPAPLAAGPAAAQSKPVLTVYTYSSFAGKYGPGKTVKERFEAVCACELAWVTAEDAGSLLGRLRLEGEGTRADAVVGLDQVTGL